MKRVIRLLVSVALIVAFMSCNVNSRETAESYVESLYRTHIVPSYQADKPLESLYERFCAPEFQDLMARDAQQNDGEIGLIDVDLWIAAQDWCDDLDLISVSRYREVSPDTVWVKTRLRNCGGEHDVMLVVTVNDNMWQVDDFPQYWDDEWHSLKSALRSSRW